MTRSISALTISQDRALVAGIPLYCPNAIFTVAGQTFTAPQAVTFINTVLAAVTATATAKGAWKDAILAEQKLVAADGTTVKEIRNNIATMFSNAMNTLSAFEIAPRKVPTPLTADQRAAATAKAKATRLARGTASKKAKAAITGNVTGVTITPVTAPTGAPAVPVTVNPTVTVLPSSGASASAPPVAAAAALPAVAPAPAVAALPAASAVVGSVTAK
jgi:hypothetical protein